MLKIIEYFELLAMDPVIFWSEIQRGLQERIATAMVFLTDLYEIIIVSPSWYHISAALPSVVALYIICVQLWKYHRSHQAFLSQITELEDKILEKDQALLCNSVQIKYQHMLLGCFTHCNNCDRPVQPFRKRGPPVWKQPLAGSPAIRVVSKSRGLGRPSRKGRRGSSSGQGAADWYASDDPNREGESSEGEPRQSMKAVKHRDGSSDGAARAAQPQIEAEAPDRDPGPPHPGDQQDSLDLSTAATEPRRVLGDGPSRRREWASVATPEEERAGDEAVAAGLHGGRAQAGEPPVSIPGEPRGRGRVPSEAPAPPDRWQIRAGPRMGSGDGEPHRGGPPDAPEEMVVRNSAVGHYLRTGDGHWRRMIEEAELYRQRAARYAADHRPPDRDPPEWREPPHLWGLPDDGPPPQEYEARGQDQDPRLEAPWWPAMAPSPPQDEAAVAHLEPQEEWRRPQAPPQAGPPLPPKERPGPGPVPPGSPPTPRREPRGTGLSPGAAAASSEPCPAAPVEDPGPGMIIAPVPELPRQSADRLRNNRVPSQIRSNPRRSHPNSGGRTSRENSLSPRNTRQS